MLCQLARTFPQFIENFLERGNPLRRRFREETVTDLLMGSLITAGGAGIIVEFPDEPKTGADMEWNFVDPDDGTFFRLLLQAKQSYGEGDVWTRHAYKELLHTSGGSSTLQAVTLCATARTSPATYPLYIFYHPARTCLMARDAGFSNVAGASLADGFKIERLVTASTTRALRTRNKSVGRIAPLLFPLSDIFCPPTILPMGPMAFAPSGLSMPLYFGRVGRDAVIGRAIPPTPRQFRDRLVDALNPPEDYGVFETELASDSYKTLADEALPTSEVPAVAHEIPRDVMEILEGHRATVRRGLNRWRVTFVSQTPPDFEGELDRFRGHLKR